MAFSATFYQFSKKQNSTAQPTASTPSKSYNISIKAQTSLHNPTITLNTAASPLAYNYCYIQTFARYYWIVEWTYDSGIWIAALRVDVLGSFKTAIGSSTQYVKRAASACDPDIIDIYPRKAGSTIMTTSGSTGLTSSLSSMTFIIGVTSASTADATIGTTVYYAVSYADCKLFIAHLVSMSYTTFTDITDDLAKWLCNPYQWIKSLVVLPIAYSGASGYGWTSASAIKFGADGNGNAFSFNCSCYVVTSTSSINKSFSIQIPKHPDVDANHSYLKAEPFSQYSVVIPPFGKMQLPSAALYSATDLHALIRIDPVTGGGTLYLSPDNLRYGSILIAEAQVGVSLPVDAAVVDLSSAGWATLIASATNAMPSNAGDGSGGSSSFGAPGVWYERSIGQAVSDLSDVASSFIDGALSSMSKMTSISNGGKLCDLGFSPQLFLEYFRIVGEDVAHFGRPLCADRQLSTLSGFILCSHAEVASSAATYAELREVESYLDTGFFYE